MIMALDRLNLCTYNCNGIGKNPKRKKVIKWIKKHCSCIIFLQETHTSSQSEIAWLKDVGATHKAYLSHGCSNARGVCTLVPIEINKNIVVESLDSEGRYVILRLALFGEQYLLVNIYAPTQDKIQEQLAFFT